MNRNAKHLIQENVYLWEGGKQMQSGKGKQETSAISAFYLLRIFLLLLLSMLLYTWKKLWFPNTGGIVSNGGQLTRYSEVIIPHAFWTPNFCLTPFAFWQPFHTITELAGPSNPWALSAQTTLKLDLPVCLCSQFRGHLNNKLRFILLYFSFFQHIIPRYFGLWICYLTC
jgi:hypothetical protein